jgi:urea transport system substrate-binding protein
MNRRNFVSIIASLAGSYALTARSAFAADTMKIAVMIPLSGPASLFGASSKACAELAVEQINARGGILKRKIEIVIGDAGLPPAEAAQTALKLWKGEHAQAFIGMHDSAVRGALTGLFKGQVPYFYTPVYEGGDCTVGTFINGETPSQQLEPVIPWLASDRKLKKWYLIGNDYIWGRNTSEAAKGYIGKAGGQIVGEEFVPFTVDNFDSSLARIRDSGADAVVVSLVGGSSVTFNKAFAGFGLSDKVVRIGSLIEENTLAGIGIENAKNLFSSLGYFSSLTTPGATAFLQAYTKRFGDKAPMLNGLAESVFEGFLMLEAIATKAGDLSVAKMQPASEGATYKGPRGTVTMRARHVDQDIYVADVTPNGFRIVKTFAHVPSGQTCKV